MMEPQEIEDEGHERIVERVAAIDVAKASGMVCVRVPHESRPGRRVSRVWEVAATTGAVTGLGDHLACQGIEKVTARVDRAITGGSGSTCWRRLAWMCSWSMPGRPGTCRAGRRRTSSAVSGWPSAPSGACCGPRSSRPAAIRELRDYTRLRTDLTQERTRHYARLEKLLEDALIKVSAVASTMTTKSVRDMIEALIAGERSPRALADLARGRMRAKRAALIEALNGRFDDHHAELARMLLDQIDALSAQIGTLTGRIEELTGAMPAARGVNADGTTGPGAGTGPGAAVRPARWRAWMRSPASPQAGAQGILAEIGLDMTRFPTAGHLVSWAKLSPRTIQSGASNRSGKTGKGNPYLKGVLGEAAAAAARTDTFLGERYRRLVRRIGKLKALVAVARSILVIIWHLLSDPAARFCELGSAYHASRIDTQRKARGHIRQLEALGYTVTLTQAA